MKYTREQLIGSYIHDSNWDETIKWFYVTDAVIFNEYESTEEIITCFGWDNEDDRRPHEVTEDTRIIAPPFEKQLEDL